MFPQAPLQARVAAGTEVPSLIEQAGLAPVRGSSLMTFVGNVRQGVNVRMQEGGLWMK